MLKKLKEAPQAHKGSIKAHQGSIVTQENPKNFKKPQRGSRSLKDSQEGCNWLKEAERG